LTALILLPGSNSITLSININRIVAAIVSKSAPFSSIFSLFYLSRRSAAKTDVSRLVSRASRPRSFSPQHCWRSSLIRRRVIASPLPAVGGVGRGNLKINSKSKIEN
jgi:hypothetical protein